MSTRINAIAQQAPICYAAAIEPTHVHLLFGLLRENLDRFVGRLKGRTSSELLKLPSNQTRSRIWTAGFWRVFLFDDEAVGIVCDYIESHNRHQITDIRTPAPPRFFLCAATSPNSPTTNVVFSCTDLMDQLFSPAPAGTIAGQHSGQHFPIRKRGHHGTQPITTNDPVCLQFPVLRHRRAVFCSDDPA